VTVLVWRLLLTRFMSNTIDMRSALLGLGLGVLVTLGVAATSSSTPVGRYQVAGTSNHGLIIDTATGRVWSGYFSSLQGKTDGDFFEP
jgi:hypothetical protein